MDGASPFRNEVIKGTVIYSGHESESIFSVAAYPGSGGVDRMAFRRSWQFGAFGAFAGFQFS